MRQTAELFLSVGNWSIFLVILFLVGRWRKWRWLWLTAVALLLVWLLSFVLSPLADRLAWEKENLYKPVITETLSGVQAVVVLGAGSSDDPRLPPAGNLYSTELARLTEGVRLYRQLENVKLVTSGDSGNGKGAPQAKMVAEAAISLGVSLHDTIMMTGTWNTESEAFQCRQRLKGMDRIVLVTSAMHMERACFWFGQVGFDVVPAPTDYQIRSDSEEFDRKWGLKSYRIELFNNWLHEFVGLKVARKNQKTNE